MEFTFDFYKNLLTELRQHFDFRSFSDYERDGRVYLRHDIDVYPENIFNFLDVERNVGVRSIFFFQSNCSFYNMLSPEIGSIIRTLEESGFEVGLHIDAADLSSDQTIEKEVKNLFDFYSGYYKLSNIISFHRPPERVLRNVVVPGFVNTYEDRFFREIRYFADSNRRCFYEQLHNSLEEDKRKSIQLVIHPYWWDFEHLDIQGLLTRLEATRTHSTRLALSKGTKIYNQFFSRRVL